MRFAKMLSMAAFGLAVSTSAAARDGSERREGVRPAVAAAVAPRAKEATAVNVEKGRPCCVTSGKTVHDHLRG